MTSVGTIIGGGFAVIRNHPGAVAVWTLIHMALALATFALMRWQMSSMGLTGSEAPSPDQIMQATMAFIIPSQLLNFVVWITGVIIACAAYRLVLRPHEPGVAGIRVGMDEVRVFGTGLILSIGFGVIFFVVLLVGMMVALATGLMVGGGDTGMGVGAAVIFALVIVAVVAAIFAFIRLSLALPLTFARRRIGIDESWSLTRGHFWTLFAAYLVIGLIVIVVGIAASIPFLSIFYQTIVEMMQNPAAAQELQQRQMAAMFDMSWLTMIGLALLSGISQAITAALTGGATATAARALLTDAGIMLEGDAESAAAIFE